MFRQLLCLLGKLNSIEGNLPKARLTNRSLVTALFLSGLTAFGGTWIPLDHPAPDNVQLMLLMTDGTVMVAGWNLGQGDNHWYKLTPDKNGSYVHGTWSTLASMANSRLWYSSVVLRDGRVFVAGGEYPTNGVGGASAEIYDPRIDHWSPVPVPTDLLDPTQPSPAVATGNQGFRDSDAILLSDGRVMVAPVAPKNAYEVLIYDPVANSWTNGPNAGLGNQNEASWIKLPDESILTIVAGTTNVERFLPENYLPGHINPVRSNQWVADEPLPIPLYGSPGNEIGPGLLLPDGTAFYIGANGNTAVYHPSGDDSPGHWTPGPVLPNVIEYLIDDNGAQIQVPPAMMRAAAPDAPAAMMVNGRILCALSAPLYNDPRVQNPPTDYWKTQKNPIYPKPTTFFVYDPVTQLFTPITAPYSGGATDNVTTYQTAMLDLPDGTVLVAEQGPQLFVYALDPVHNPDDRIDPNNRPTISTVTPNLDGSWHLTGIQLNGLSQGAAYGDDAQMDCNYPLVRFVADTGEITYARTFNWSSTGVQTKDRIVSTDFTIPAVVAGSGGIHLEVVANGIASDPAPFPLVLAEEMLTFAGNESMGNGPFEILGGITTFQDDLSASGILLRGAGGVIQLLDFATADTSTINVDGGMGDGGIPGFLEFRNNSTAAQATIENRPGVLGPNFKNASPNPTAGLGGETRFLDSALAGAAYIVNSAAAFGSSYDGTITSFADNTSADHATILNNGVSATTSPYAYGGETEFTGSATAGFATVTNLNSNNGTQYSQGRTVFFDTAIAANALFVNIGGASGFLPAGGTTEFRGSSSAANGTFMNWGGTGGSFPGRGTTQFFDTATAGNGTFTNKPGYGSGGAVEFYGHSTAANGTFVNDGPFGSVGGAGGEFLFRDDSVAGQAHFTSTGLYGGGVTFRDRSSADHGNYLITANVYDSRFVFYGTSTADHGNFEIGGGGDVQFFESSTAGNAAIVIRGNETSGQGASAQFSGSATADQAHITIWGAENPGTVGGGAWFQGPATAGNSTMTINGASVTTFGASGGLARFDYGASAGIATITANGGVNGGTGARLEFARGATADQAHITVNAGAALDVSGNLGTHVGSLQGSGTIWINYSPLYTGGLNEDTTFTGEIAGRTTPPFGSLTKEGTGTFWLGGTNTFGGLTTVAAGTLVVSGSLASDVQVNTGATFKGCGSVAGTVTVEPGAIVSPGCSPGTLTIGGDYLQNTQGILEIEVAGPNPADRDLLIVNGNVNLSGTLLLVFSGYAPSPSETFPIVQVGGGFTDNNLKIIVLGLKPGYQPTYQFANGMLVLTASSGGQLANATDPVQNLPPTFASQSGFVFPVFTFSGDTYQFDTSTDFMTWSRLKEIPGVNGLFEFRDLRPTAEPYRFYRVIQQSSGP